MDKKLETIVQALQENFSVTFEEFRGEAHVFVKAENIVEALTLLRDKYDFELLSALTAIGLLAATVAALSCDLSVDIAGEEPIAAVESPCGRRRAADPDRDRGL